MNNATRLPASTGGYNFIKVVVYRKFDSRCSM